MLSRGFKIFGVEPAIGLRLGEKSAGYLQYLIGAAELLALSTQCFNAVTFVGADTVRHAARLHYA